MSVYPDGMTLASLERNQASKPLSTWDELALNQVRSAEKDLRDAMHKLAAARDLSSDIDSACCDAINGMSDILADLEAARKGIEE